MRAVRAYCQRWLAAAFVAVAFALPAQAACPSFEFDPRLDNFRSAGDKYYRTELYFGRDKPDGSVVSDDEWKSFLDREVTSRFPDGFTTLDGAGQYRDKSGKIIKEPSKVAVFLYAKKDRKTAGAKIDEIRAAYCKQFDQESVLRVDITRVVISF